MPPPPHTLAGPGQGSVRRVPRLCVRMCIRVCLALVLGAQRTSGEAKWNPMASPITQAPSSIRYLLDSYGILASGQMNGMGWRHLDDAEEAPGAHVSLPNSWAVTGSQVCNASDRAPWLESRFGNNATLWAPDIPPHTTYEREGMPVYFSVHDPYNGSCVMRALGHLVHAPNNYTVVEPWTARWEMDKEPVLCTPIGVAEGPNAAEPSVLVDPETDTLWMAIGSHHGELNKIVERERSRLDGLGINELAWGNATYADVAAASAPNGTVGETAARDELFSTSGVDGFVHADGVGALLSWDSYSSDNRTEGIWLAQLNRSSGTLHRRSRGYRDNPNNATYGCPREEFNDDCFFEEQRQNETATWYHAARNFQGDRAISSPALYYLLPNEALRGLYFLFVTWGAENGTEIRVGRSENITGPYVDSDGVDMVDGGGRLFLSSRDMGEGRLNPRHVGFYEWNYNTSRGKPTVDDVVSFTYDVAIRPGEARLAARVFVWEDVAGGFWPRIIEKDFDPYWFRHEKYIPPDYTILIIILVAVFLFGCCLPTALAMRVVYIRRAARVHGQTLIQGHQSLWKKATAPCFDCLQSICWDYCGVSIKRLDRTQFLATRYNDLQGEVLKAFEELEVPEDDRLLWLDQWARIDEDASNTMVEQEFFEYMGWPVTQWTQRLFECYSACDENDVVRFRDFLHTTWRFCVYDRQLMHEFAFRMLSRRGPGFDIDHTVIDINDVKYMLAERYSHLPKANLKKIVLEIFFNIDDDGSGGISFKEFVSFSRTNTIFLAHGHRLAEQLRAKIFGKEYWLEQTTNRFDIYLFDKGFVDRLDERIVSERPPFAFADDFHDVHKRMNSRHKEGKEAKKLAREFREKSTAATYKRMVLKVQRLFEGLGGLTMRYAFYTWQDGTHPNFNDVLDAASGSAASAEARIRPVLTLHEQILEEQERSRPSADEVNTRMVEEQLVLAVADAALPYGELFDRASAACRAGPRAAGGGRKYVVR